MVLSEFVEPLGFDTQSSRAVYEAFKVTPINGALGAEVHGVDLSHPLHPHTLEQLENALLNHLVIVFRDQHLSPHQLVAVGKQFGDLHLNPFVKGLEGCPEVIEVKSEENHAQRFTGL